MKKGINWELFSELVMRNQVAILVYDALKELEPYASIPKPVYDRLKLAYLHTLSRTTSSHKELMDILKLFDKEKIPVFPLKGTLLAKRFYGDISARGINADLDLLIKEEDKDAAKHILEKTGYQCGKADDVLAWQWEYNFTKHEATAIDLHWDITMMCRSKDRIEGLWKGSRCVEEDDTKYYELKEEELLLFLCAHFANSGGYKQLRYVCDINELLSKYKDRLDWDSLIKKAKSWKLSNSLFFALKLSKNLLNSEVPFEVLSRIKPGCFKRVFIKVFANRKVVFRNGLRRRLVDALLSYIFFELIEAQSPKEYLSIFKRVFFPPKAAIANKNYIQRSLGGLAKILKIILT